MATRTVLLIEDDPADALLARETLRDVAPDVSVVHAPCGADAIALLRNAPGRFDLVLVDLNLPGIDGIALLRSRRGDEALTCIPFVAFTTSASPHDLRAAYTAGANAFVTKPADLDDYAEVMRATIAFWLGAATSPHQDP